jgi:hypothetical protein
MSYTFNPRFLSRGSNLNIKEAKMAKLTFSPIVTDVRKRLGNVVFSKWKKTNYLRTYSAPTGEATENQKEVRQAFKILVKVWKNLPGALKQSWNVYAKNKNMTGYNAFMAANATLQREGSFLQISRDNGLNSLGNFSAESVSTGEINCSFILSQDAEEAVIVIQKRENGLGTDDIKTDLTADTVSPFIITGLVSNTEYALYAMAFSGDINSNGKVSSASTSLITVL